MMLKHISIRLKLGILFSITFLSIVVLTLQALQMSQDATKSIKRVYERSLDVQHIQEKLINPLNLLRETSLSLVMAPNKTFRAGLKKKLFPTIKVLEQSFEQLLEKKPFLVSQWKDYQQAVLETYRYIEEGFEEGAFINANTVERDFYYKLLEHLNTLQLKALNRAKESFNQNSMQTKEYQNEVLTMAGFVLFMALLFGYAVSQNIIRSLHIFQNGLRGFFDYLNAKTKTSHTIVLNQRDELGLMAKEVNQNIRFIQKKLEQDLALIQNATQVMHDLRLGNLESRLEKESEYEALNTLKVVINEMIDSLEEQIQKEIKKRSNQEQLLIQQSKLASMGEMIGNIAHQWRQPLSEINAILMNMQVRYEFNDFDKTFFYKKVEEANTITAYMSNTISDFQNFFKPSKEKECFSIHEACQKALFILESSLKYHNIEVKLKMNEDKFINGYANEYAQVILNILSNAKDVLMERQVKNPYIKIEIKTGKRYSVVKIEDNAGGIHLEDINRVFEPYFSTKHAKQGTGIGLYMSKTIIEENMQGFLNVKNTNAGAMFVVKV